MSNANSYPKFPGVTTRDHYATKGQLAWSAKKFDLTPEKLAAFKARQDAEIAAAAKGAR